MLQLQGEVLDQPAIEIGENHRAEVRINQIRLRGHLFKPKPIAKLAVTYFGWDFDRNKSKVDWFFDNLKDIMQRYQIYGSHEEHIVEPIPERIEGYFRSMKEQGCELIVCITEFTNNEEYKQLKVNITECGTLKYGLMTQCSDFAKIANPQGLRIYCENLVLKINFRKAGINMAVDLDEALQRTKASTDAFMFFSADFIHPTNVTRYYPSIAALVGSGNSFCSTTAVRVSQQYPKQGKCSIETILGLKEMVEELLDYYEHANGYLPNKIVFYRDGVDDGQFSKVIAQEIPLIYQAFDTKYGNKSNHPRLTFIVVKKRHHTRFSVRNQSERTITNLPVGTLVNTTIVHPYQHNFYLNSHKAIQGVNRPSLYHVLLDEIGFSAEDLHLLTYHLCFTDPRSTSIEAIPSIVHQADVAALKARDLFYDDKTSSEGNGSDHRRIIKNPTAADLSYTMLQVYRDLKNLPVLI